MKNLFDFNYTEKTLLNANGTNSNFRQIFGQNGVNVACPKSTFHIVQTEDLSLLGNAFIDKAYKVDTFTHRNGEIIGLNVGFGSKMAKVGDSQYNLIITVPNNNSGKGYLSINQTRLICTNGMTSSKTMHKDNYIKIPHTMNYKSSIELMKVSIDGFTSLLEQVENKDNFLASNIISDTDVLFHLNKWFFENEFPTSQKNGMTLNDFRKFLVTDRTQIKCIDRYNELMVAYKKELGYNKELNLDLSMYTAYASVTNYLSRRIEKSNSSADSVTQFERQSKKLEYFEAI